MLFSDLKRISHIKRHNPQTWIVVHASEQSQKKMHFIPTMYVFHQAIETATLIESRLGGAALTKLKEQTLLRANKECIPLVPHFPINESLHLSNINNALCIFLSVQTKKLNTMQKPEPLLILYACCNQDCIYRSWSMQTMPCLRTHGYHFMIHD